MVLMQIPGGHMPVSISTDSLSSLANHKGSSLSHSSSSANLAGMSDAGQFPLRTKTPLQSFQRSKESVDLKPTAYEEFIFQVEQNLRPEESENTCFEGVGKLISGTFIRGSLFIARRLKVFAFFKCKLFGTEFTHRIDLKLRGKKSEETFLSTSSVRVEALNGFTWESGVSHKGAESSTYSSVEESYFWDSSLSGKDLREPTSLTFSADFEVPNSPVKANLLLEHSINRETSFVEASAEMSSPGYREHGEGITLSFGGRVRC